MSSHCTLSSFTDLNLSTISPQCITLLLIWLYLHKVSCNIDWKKSVLLSNVVTSWRGCRDTRVTVVHLVHWLNLTLSHRLACCRYSIDRRTDMDRLFNIHGGNGSVFLLRSLDREESAWHNISVIATEFSKSSSGQGYLPRWCDVLM